MYKHYLIFMTGSLAIVLGVMLSPAAVLAGSTNKLPVPQLQGPSSLSTGQPFVVSFTYPKGSANRYGMELFHCAPGVNAHPSNDNDTEPFPGGGCDPARTYGPNQISLDTGHVDIDVGQGLQKIQHHNQGSSPEQFAQWLEGSWFVRVRLVGTSGTQGTWSDWHRTTIGSGSVSQRKPTQGLRVDTSRLATAVVMRGLKPPVITQPGEGQVFRGQNIPLSFTLPQHGHYADWGCCDFEIQRVKFATQENDDYVEAHTPPGQTPNYNFQTAREPWSSPSFANGYTTEKGPSASQSAPIGLFQPNSHAFGYQYWFRVRERYTPGEALGPWSAWRSFVVQMPFSGGGSASGLQRGFLPGQMKPGSHSGGGFMPKTSAPPVHTMSGHMPGIMTPARPGSATGHNLHVNPLPPHVRVIQQNEKVDYTCANLDRLITVHEEVHNDGGPLPAGHAQIYINEYGGAHIHGTKVPVPPLAHGASVWLNMAAGTAAAHAADLPGVHHVDMTLTVDGKPVSSFLTFTLDANKCKPGVRHLVPMHPMRPMRVNPRPVFHPPHIRTR